MQSALQETAVCIIRASSAAESNNIKVSGSVDIMFLFLNVFSEFGYCNSSHQLLPLCTIRVCALSTLFVEKSYSSCMNTDTKV